MVVHGASGLGLLLLTPGKLKIARRGLRRPGRSRKVTSLAFAAAVLLAIGSGLLHAIGGFRPYLGLLPMQIHVGSALVAVLLLGMHLWAHARRGLPRRTDLDRRVALRGAGLVAGAAALWLVAPGRERRVTGSHEVGSGDPAVMPVTQWLLDPVPRLSSAAWRLRVPGGALDLAALAALPQHTERAVLDCTGGWWAEQEWRGVPLAALGLRAGWVDRRRVGHRVPPPVPRPRRRERCCWPPTPPAARCRQGTAARSASSRRGGGGSGGSSGSSPSRSSTSRGGGSRRSPSSDRARRLIEEPVRRSRGARISPMRALRTPDERFAELPGFDLPPRYADVPDQDGAALRMSWVEDGPPDGPVVLLLHGEPSWSYLYRTMIPVLAGAGLRAVAPDLVGFGRSDKPAELADHSYARHVEWVRALAFDVLDLRAVTLVGQDWGGLIGLRLVAEHPRAVRAGRRVQHGPAHG